MPVPPFHLPRALPWLGLGAVLIGVLAPAVHGREEATREEPVAATLQAATRRVAPGAAVALRLRLSPAPGWYVLRRDPDTQGGSPTVRWQVPEGVTLGEARWPPADRVVEEPTAREGYAGEVELVLPVYVSETFEGKSFGIDAKVEWIACADDCERGEATRQVVLEVPRRGPAMRYLAVGLLGLFVGAMLGLMVHRRRQGSRTAQ